MNTSAKLLMAVLILSMLVPMPVAVSSLFHQESALKAFHLKELSPDLEKMMLVSGVYMLSFVVLFAVAATWVAKGNPVGITLSMALGVITLLRGILLLVSFSSHNFESSVVAIAATINGVLIILFSFMARPSDIHS